MKKHFRSIELPLLTVLLVLLLTSCGGSGGGNGGGRDTNETIIPETTKVLDESTMQSLSSVSEEGILTFEQSTPALQSLSSGDILVSDVTTSALNGLLRKVVSISQNGNQVIIETEHATLEDAIEKGSIEISKTLTTNDISAATALLEGVTFKSMIQAQKVEGFFVEINNVVLYDGDGNLGTTQDQIKANGSISLNPGFDFNITIEDFQLKQLAFINTTTETTQLELRAEIEIIGILKEVELARYNFPPITIWVGLVPVVITPVLTINVGLDGEVSVGITTGVTQEATVTAGLTYNNGTWSTIKDFSNDFQFNPPSLLAEARVKAYAGPQLKLLIYGVVGPHGDIRGYSELDAEISPTTTCLEWKLYGGLEAGIGVRFEILSSVIAGFEKPDLIDHRLLLNQSDLCAASLIGVRWNGTAEEFGVIDTTTGSFNVIGIVGDLATWGMQTAINGNTLYVIGQNSASQDKLYISDTNTGALINTVNLGISGHTLAGFTQ